MEEEKPDSPPVKVRSCVLESDAQGVRIIMDGRLAKAVPFDTYETFHKNLSRGLEFNVFPVETADGGEIKLQLPPLAEVRAGKVALPSLDGETYGRRYRLISVAREADGKPYAVIALADTGAVVERAPWEDFKRRVEFGRCRSGTAYGQMLGELNPRLYFDVTGQIYKSEDAQRKEQAAGAAEKEAPEGGPKAEEEQPGKLAPLLKAVAAGRERIAQNPRFVYIGAAVSFLILLIGVSMIVFRTAPKPPKPAVKTAALFEHDLNEQYQIASALGARNFSQYARENPVAAKDAVDGLAAFVEQHRHALNLTPEQTKRLLFISDTLPQLQAARSQAVPK